MDRKFVLFAGLALALGALLASAASARAGVSPLLDRLQLYADRYEFTLVREQASALDVEGGAALRINRRLSLTGGYRMMNMDLESSNVLRGRVNGPVFRWRLGF